MKELNLLIWVSQLGFSTAVPLAAFVLLGVWLHNSRGWGLWVIFAGIGLGLFSAISGFINTLKTLQRISGDKKRPGPTAVFFNEHD